VPGYDVSTHLADNDCVGRSPDAASAILEENVACHRTADDHRRTFAHDDKGVIEDNASF
jgi:hypothetical protein